MATRSNETDYDVVVVGGGSAGCALASRLSEDESRRVLLVEAGPDIKPGEEPAAIRDSFPLVAYFSRGYQWSDLRVSFTPAGSNARPPVRRRYEQARVIGGGSAINGQFANRGAPADYDSWESEYGATGWNWEGVLPYFRRLERDLDVEGELHGNEGPIPISRVKRDQWQPFTVKSAEMFASRGHVELDDQNGAWRDGFFAATTSNDRKGRVTSAMGYLTSAVRARPNLTIATEATVLRLLTDRAADGELQATGIEYRQKGHTRRVAAGEVILSMGAIHTPAFLMKNGIGKARDLKALGIEVLVDRRAVGANLREHPSIVVSAYLKRGYRQDFKAVRRHIQAALRATSGETNCGDGDLFICPLSRSGWHAVGERLASYITILNDPYSQGSVRLVDPAPDSEPQVDFNLLSDERDLRRVMAAVRLTHSFFRSEPVSSVTEHPFLTAYSEKVRSFSVFNKRNAMIMRVLGLALDAAGPLRKTMIEKFISEAEPLSTLLADDMRLADAVRSTVAGVWHPAGTCRIGRADDPDAVVDSEARVIGVRNLRVADASIIPRLMRGNTNIPCMMIGEKVADIVKRSGRVASGGRNGAGATATRMAS